MAVHAVTLGSEGLSLTLRYETMLVLRESECFALQAHKEPECCLRYCKIIVLYTKDSFMFRSRFSSVGQAGAAGGAAHGQVSSSAEISVPHSSEHSRKAVLS